MGFTRVVVRGVVPVATILCPYFWRAHACTIEGPMLYYFPVVHIIAIEITRYGYLIQGHRWWPGVQQAYTIKIQLLVVPGSGV